jgi:CheY-like chemotaxis protein
MSKAAILCVDDEIIILDSLKIQLRYQFGERYLYESAESPHEALEILDELEGEGIRTVVIVSDWLMPGMKGDEFLIHVHQKFPNVIKVMLTGQADESAIQRAYQQANLHHCLQKPWDSQQLMDVIEKGLAKLQL